MSTLNELARRLNSMCDQAGQPDWSLGEFLDGVRNVAEDLKRVSVPPEPRAAEDDLVALRSGELQRLAELAEDGERYRWLQDRGPCDGLLVYRDAEPDSLLPDELDSAIDAARAAPQDTEGEGK